MPGAVFSDVEGTLVEGSLPGMFIRGARELGLISKPRLLQALVINTAAKPMPRSLNVKLRYAAISAAMKGMSVAQASQVLEHIMPVVNQALKPAAVARLREHVREGLPVVLVSGALQAAVERIAQELGVSGEGTHMEIVNQRYSGRGSTPCMGEEKARRVRQLAQSLNVNLAESYGYGDTLNDVPFLRLMGKACVIDPVEPELAEIATREGWEILRTGQVPAQV